MDNRKILSDQEIEKIIAETDATMAVEGYEPADFSNEVFRDYAKGKINESVAIEIIKKHVLCHEN